MRGELIYTLYILVWNAVIVFFQSERSLPSFTDILRLPQLPEEPSWVFYDIKFIFNCFHSNHYTGKKLRIIEPRWYNIKNQNLT